jgi:tRNA (cmo5U34)-methyltransferase
MTVAAHLKIQIDEYDSRIRTFVPAYEELLSAAAEGLRLLRGQSLKIVDLGIGTGALAAHCLAVHHDAHILGIDNDPAMLDVARARLANHHNLDLVCGNFLSISIPPCDAIVASIALHHIKTPEEKNAFYRKCYTALRPGGILVSADCFPAREPRLAEAHRKLWLQHLEQTYPPPEAEAHLTSWAEEDRYFPLQDEVEWLQNAGFDPEVLWRVGAFAVLLGGQTRDRSAGL